LIKLNLGFGNLPRQHYYNVDSDKISCRCAKIDGYSRVIMADVRHLPFDDHSVDEIYASHLLEHFGVNDIIPLLREWLRVMRKGGTLTIRVPNMRAIANAYAAEEKHHVTEVASVVQVGIWRYFSQIWGLQTGSGQFHKSGSDKESLNAILGGIGISRRNYRFTTSKRFDIPDGNLRVIIRR